ncbi:hypothetical protein NQZ79_g1193 [Umbelopsis isabellina]|nr:hypothetical protein NQZ79_g1193 [Umbelopsis isabellina]
MEAYDSVNNRGIWQKLRDDSLVDDFIYPILQQDLAVTPAKVKSVKTWIHDSLATGTQNGNKLLIMSGPSGCGKSTTVRTLARTMDFDIQEWTTFGSTTKWDDLVDKQDYESLMTNFVDYLTRSLRHDRTIQTSTSTSSKARRKVILIDDIPDLTYGTSRRRFHDLMRGICRPSDSHVPVILTLTTLEESRGSEPRRGAKKNIYDFADNVDFVRYTSTTNKRLEKIISAIYKSEALDIPIDFDAITAASHGDIRSAINNLQFYAIPKKQDGGSGSDNHLAAGAIGRESPLDLFHAIGKALYAKRRWIFLANITTCDFNFDSFWPTGTSNGTLESVPEDILASMSADEQTFILWLHQNYTPFMDDIFATADAIDWLSIANHLASLGDGYTGSEYESLLSIRGLMYSRKAPSKYHPVNKPDYWEFLGKESSAPIQPSSVLLPSLNLNSPFVTGNSQHNDEDFTVEIGDTTSEEEDTDDMWGDLDDDLLAALPDSQNFTSAMELSPPS